MDETRKEEDEADIKSTRDVLQKWNDYYINNNFGIGIQCDKCKKWRQVFQYQDTSEVPEVWICSMWRIDEIRRGSCRLPSDLKESDFAEALYSPGSLVWAKMDGYPWWAGMIEDCPDVQHFFMPYADSEHEYHVNFFGSKPQRNWMKASHIKDFSMTPPATPKAKKNKDLQKSIEQANEAQKLSVKERLKKYSFAVRYEGHWAKVKEFDKVDLPPNCLKRRKEKSADFRSQVIAEEPHGSRDCKRTKTARMERNVKSKSATKRKSADNEEFQPSLSRKEKIEENNHSRNQFSVLGKANEEFQPSLSHEEKIEKNNHSRNQFAVLGKANEEFQPSLSHEEKMEENNRSREQFAVLGKANEESQPSLRHEEKIEKNNRSRNQFAVLGKANEEFQPSLSRKEKIEENNHSRNQFTVLGKANEEFQPSLCHEEKMEENNRSRDQFAVLGKANEESQPSFSHEEKIEKNNRSRNQFAVLGKANEEFQPSLSHEEKIEKNNHSGNQSAVLGKANEEFQPSLSHKEKMEENSRSRDQFAVLSKANEEFQPSVSHKEKIEEKNLSGNQFAVLGKAGAKEKPESSGKCVQQLVQAKTHEDGLREEHHNTEDEKNKESSEEEDSSVHSDTTISSDEDENMASPDLKAYSEFLRKMYPPIVYGAKKVSLSGNDTGNYSANGSSDLAIHKEHSATFSENVSVINQESAAEFSEKNPVINHGNIAEYSQNDSDAYILGTDPSLLRTPYPSCYTPKNEQFSNRRERFKKNRELTDKLINSNNSKYMPYSFYRGRMKK